MDMFDVVNRATYLLLSKKFGTAIPSNAISCIKFDEANQPVRAKYRVVALGNHEKRHWSKNDWYAPVCSLNDVRLITALVCLSRRPLKQDDCKNAFCQSYLPKDARIFVIPPCTCPLSDQDTYWFLKKTLYGLRRSPIH